MFLTDLICGVGGGMPSMSPEANTQDLGGGNYHKSLPKWMAGEGDAGQVDAASADQEFHSEPNNILQVDIWIIGYDLLCFAQIATSRQLTKEPFPQKLVNFNETNYVLFIRLVRPV